MMPTLALTPAAAGRLYDGQHFHRSRSPQENRRMIRDTIKAMKASPSPFTRYAGCIIEAISKINPRDLVPKTA